MMEKPKGPRVLIIDYVPPSLLNFKLERSVWDFMEDLG